MWSTRARIAAAYGGLLLVTLLAFILAVFVARRSAAFEELAAFGFQSGIAADGVLQAIANSEATGKRLTLRDSTLTVTPELRPVWSTSVRPLPELQQLLDPWQGFFLVLDEKDRLLYTSNAMRRLPREDQDHINEQVVDLYPTGRAAVVPLSIGSRILIVARADSTLQPNISRVIAGVLTYDPGVPAQLLFGTMFLIAPLMVLVSVAVAYVIAGNTFK